MAEFSKLSGKKGALNESLAGFFKDMLEKNVVDAVLVPAHQPVKGVMQTIFTDPSKLDSVDPFAPVVPLNSAKIVSNLTNVPSGRPLAVVMRSCEVRALLELVKLKQATMDDLVIIGMDCLGRYENTDYQKLEQDGVTTESFLEKGAGVSKDVELSSACKICEYPAPDAVWALRTLRRLTRASQLRLPA